MLKTKKFLRNNFSYKVGVCLFATFVFIFSLNSALSSKSSKAFQLVQSPVIQSPIELEGKLQVLHSDDFEQKKVGYEYFLETINGTRYRLVTDGQLPQSLRSGYKVRVKGIQIGSNQIKLERTSGESGTTSTNQGISIIEVPPEPADTARKVAVVLFNFRNDTSTPYSKETAKSWTFTDPASINEYFQEVSYDKTSLTGKNNHDGDIYDWTTIDYDNGPECDYYAWGTAAKDKLTAAGVDMNGYGSIIYGFPQTSSCHFSGLASLGGDFAFVNGNATRDRWHGIVAHEIGHNYGANHASSWTCRDQNGQIVVLSLTCTHSEYGDPFDMMGSSFDKHPNNFLKQEMGFVSDANSQTISASGDYTLNAVEPKTTGTQLIRIPYDKDDYGSTRYLYLEYRQPYGFDDFASTDPVVNGVTIRISDGRSLLVDTTPDTPSDFNDAPLAAGRTFSVANKSISISVLETSSTSARIRINYGGFTYNAAECSELDAPDRIAAGQQFAIKARFTNKGSSTWSTSATDPYTAYQQYPQQATPGELAKLQTNTAPGQVGSFEGTFTAPNITGSYYFDYAPQQGTQTFTGLCSKIIKVVEELSPPAAPRDLRKTAQTNNSISMSWTPSTDNVGVEGYRLFRSTNGATYELVTSLTSTSFTDTGLKVATPYNYYVVAYDASENVSPNSNILSVTLPDKTPPSKPGNLRSTNQTASTVSLAWNASGDNVGVTGYKLYRRLSIDLTAQLVNTVTALSYKDSGLQPATAYIYYVTAIDAAGNESAQSNEIVVRTKTCLTGVKCL